MWLIPRTRLEAKSVLPLWLPIIALAMCVYMAICR